MNIFPQKWYLSQGLYLHLVQSLFPKHHVAILSEKCCLVIYHTFGNSR